MSGNAVRLLVACLLLAAAPAAADSLDGGIIVRVDDESVGRCISAQDDAVTLQLVRAVENKYSGWISSDKSIGLYIETTIEGATGSATKKVTFPRAFLIGVNDYQSGRVSLPVEQKLLSRFRLKNGDNVYSSAEFAIRLVKIQKDGAATIALRILADSTKNLPIPANPFTDGLDFFVDLSNRLVDKYIDGELSDTDSADRAKLALEFSPNGDCSGGLATTGALAVIFNNDQPETADDSLGVLSISKESDYCFRYRSQPARRIELALSVKGVCPTDNASFHTLQNAYYLFVLNAAKAQADSAKVNRYIWFNPKESAISPVPNLDKTSIDKVVGNWTTLSKDNLVKGDKTIAALNEFDSVSPSQYKTKFGIDTIWGEGKNNEFIADFAGATRPATTDFFIGKQSVSGYDAVAQDLAVAIGRCKQFDIPEEDCF
ncbi:hypothetical protein LB518_14425 [Mesorhizobium sp. BR1-1-16]|uniref:hypothetical protein n=1 Tax=Mesorhizobium sp. BR1-1-16 TaxID=2876653 RepID=UPI001CCC0CF0|nr:hypothetical protein [Mesorhizobium sp. BR1-1-16]MBZ9937497.1 hypothetical protein [Mesorhizobium sp. BR1-1-16]